MVDEETRRRVLAAIDAEALAADCLAFVEVASETGGEKRRSIILVRKE